MLPLDGGLGRLPSSGMQGSHSVKYSTGLGCLCSGALPHRWAGSEALHWARQPVQWSAPHRWAGSLPLEALHGARQPVQWSTPHRWAGS